MGKHNNNPGGRAPGDGKPGYKNIDPKHRWKKGGSSPNPGGQRKAPPPPSFEQRLWESIQGLIDAPVTVGGASSMTFLDGLLRRLIVEGVNDPKHALKALEFILAIERRVTASSRHDAGGDRSEDEEIVAQALLRMARGAGGGDA